MHLEQAHSLTGFYDLATAQKEIFNEKRGTE
jgi:hypothetical protein